MARNRTWLAVLLGGLLLGAALPQGVAAQTTAGATAVIRIPELLSVDIRPEWVDGELRPVAHVRANSEWRLTVRLPDRDVVFEGQPGRDERRVLPVEVLEASAAGRPAEVTLAGM